MKYYCGLPGVEFDESELPALKLLHEGLGYDYLLPSEANQLRKKDSDVILYDILKQQLPELNPWMKKHPEAIDAVMPEPEAEPYLDDFDKLTTTVTHIKNFLNKDKFSTKPYSNKIQQLIDKHVAAGKIKIPIDSIDFDDENFGIEISKMGSKGAQNAALSGRLSGVIDIGKPDNPIFYGDLEEQLQHLLQSEEDKRIDAEQLFQGLTKLQDDSQKQEQKRKELGLENDFEFAVFGELKQIVDEQSLCIEKSILIYESILPLTKFVDCFNPEKIAIRKDMERIIYEALSDKFPEDKIDELTEKIIDLAKRHLHDK